MKTYFTIALIAALGFLIVCGQVQADRRNFAWSYEYKTMPKGEAELEHYFTPRLKKIEDEFKISWEHQVELEYGITDHFDVGFYQMFKQEPDSSLKYDGYKLRGRYRFGEQGLYFLNPLVYLEFIQKPDEIEFEEKLILTKNIRKSFLSFNLTLEQEFEKEEHGSHHEESAESEEEIEVEYIINPSFGIGYQFSPRFSASLELWNHIEIVEGEMEHSAFFAGPTVSFAGEKVWWTLSVLPQLTQIHDEHSHLQVRSLVGIFF